MINRDVFLKDPASLSLLNNGVAKVADEETAEQLRTLRFELETFVCEGEYERGLCRILETFLKELDKPEQPAVWVSGFYGSGKSHLVKVLRALWVDHVFPEDGATARGITHLSEPVRELLRELTTVGKRHGLHAASGTLGAAARGNVRLGLLGIVFRSAGLPPDYYKARFVMWLRARGLYEAVEKHLAAAGTSLREELPDMYVSPPLAEALLAADPSFAPGAAEAKQLLAAQYPKVDDVSIDDMVDAIRKALTRGKKFPATLVALDEIQQHIGESSERAYEIQEIAEACASRFDGKLVLVGTGQTALSGTPLLQKLMGRFRVQVELLDTDVETVTRRMVLAKKPDKAPAVRGVLESAKGEVARHLAGTQIEPRPEDAAVFVPDYPLLPVRRRFWERALRAVDRAGTAAQLRSMLRIVLEAVQETANRPLGHVIPADTLFDQNAAEMRRTGVLLPEIHEVIVRQKDVNPHGRLRSRLAGLVFLIGKLPREAGADLGVRANADTLADLLVEDLLGGSPELRALVPDLLARMAQDGVLMRVADEYRLQTRESSAWNEDYQQRYARVINDPARMSGLIADQLNAECHEQLKDVKKLQQGKSKQPRKVELCFNDDALTQAKADVPVRVYNGWSDDENTVRAEVGQASTDSPTVCVFIPKTADADLKKALAGREAARETLDARGEPSTDAGREAQSAIETRRKAAESELRSALHQVFRNALVFQAGVQADLPGSSLGEKVGLAAETALTRLYPHFGAGDDPGWDTVFDRARKGDGAPLKAVGHDGNTEAHPVCAKVLAQVGAGKKGAEVREHFARSPYGWPRDTVDGALVALCASGHLRCAHQGKPVDVKQVEKARVAHYDFRAETVTVPVAQRMALRGLYQEAASLTCKPNEEAAVAGTFLQKMLELAAGAGGEAPLPAPPDTSHLHEIAAKVGNEQLLELAQNAARLKGEAAEWRKRAERARQRRPRWENLQRLLGHAEGLPEAGEVGAQVDAIKSQRTLLADHDPVPPLCEKLTAALRAALVKAQADFKSAHAEQMKSLGTAGPWQKLSGDQQVDVLRRYNLESVPAIQTGTEGEVLKCLDGMPLAQRATRRDALPQQFHKALVEAAQHSEPKAVALSLPRATIKDPDELEAWLTAVRQEVLKRLQDGPVIV